MKEDPDRRFEYCNGASYLLTAVLQKTMKPTGLEFAKEHLFNPLGITDLAWKANAQGITIGYFGLYMLPRDMARFGYLYLKNGKWDDRQIVPVHWVTESTRNLISAGTYTGYGYHWWVMSPGRYAAIGNSGQRIYVIKDKNMVVVFTSMLQERKGTLPYGILMGYILPAVKSDKPIPENPGAFSRLKSLGDFWQTANYNAKYKKRKELTAKHPGPKLKTYLNKQFGFSVDYDSELVLSGKTLEPPLVLKKMGLLGLPVIIAMVDDIPDGLKLEDSEKAVFRRLKEILNFSEIAIHEKEVIRLSDGTTANCFEFTLKHKKIEYLAAGVVGYKDKKTINITAFSYHFTPPAQLKDMVTTLKLKIEKP
ncbi:MAG: serine hydrolase, partial [Desulfobacterales bacterium]|nr:serine hydrolase [Desulfobacterales bacterium]